MLSGRKVDNSLSLDKLLDQSTRNISSKHKKSYFFQLVEILKNAWGKTYTHENKQCVIDDSAFSLINNYLQSKKLLQTHDYLLVYNFLSMSIDKELVTLCLRYLLELDQKNLFQPIATSLLADLKWIDECVAAGRKDLIACLLKLGCDIHYVLTRAIENQKWDVAEMALQEKFYKELNKRLDIKYFEVCVTSEQKHLVSQLLKKDAAPIDALVCAVTNKKWDIAKIILQEENGYENESKESDNGNNRKGLALFNKFNQRDDGNRLALFHATAFSQNELAKEIIHKRNPGSAFVVYRPVGMIDTIGAAIWNNNIKLAELLLQKCELLDCTAPLLLIAMKVPDVTKETLSWLLKQNIKMVDSFNDLPILADCMGEDQKQKREILFSQKDSYFYEHRVIQCLLVLENKSKQWLIEKKVNPIQELLDVIIDAQPDQQTLNTVPLLSIAIRAGLNKQANQLIKLGANQYEQAIKDATESKNWEVAKEIIKRDQPINLESYQRLGYEAEKNENKEIMTLLSKNKWIDNKAMLKHALMDNELKIAEKYYEKSMGENWTEWLVYGIEKECVSLDTFSWLLKKLNHHLSFKMMPDVLDPFFYESNHPNVHFVQQTESGEYKISNQKDLWIYQDKGIFYIKDGRCHYLEGEKQALQLIRQQYRSNSSTAWVASHFKNNYIEEETAVIDIVLKRQREKIVFLICLPCIDRDVFKVYTSMLAKMYQKWLADKKMSFIQEHLNFIIDAKFDKQDLNDMSLLSIAIQAGLNKQAKQLIELGVNQFDQAVKDVTEFKNWEIAKEIIKRDTPQNLTDYQLLCYAAEKDSNKEIPTLLSENKWIDHKALMKHALLENELKIAEKYYDQSVESEWSTWLKLGIKTESIRRETFSWLVKKLNSRFSSSKVGELLYPFFEANFKKTMLNREEGKILVLACQSCIDRSVLERLFALAVYHPFDLGIKVAAEHKHWDMAKDILNVTYQPQSLENYQLLGYIAEKESNKEIVTLLSEKKWIDKTKVFTHALLGNELKVAEKYYDKSFEKEWATWLNFGIQAKSMSRNTFSWLFKKLVNYISAENIDYFLNLFCKEYQFNFSNSLDDYFFRYSNFNVNSKSVVLDSVLEKVGFLMCLGCVNKKIFNKYESLFSSFAPVNLITRLNTFIESIKSHSAQDRLATYNIGFFEGLFSSKSTKEIDYFDNQCKQLSEYIRAVAWHYLMNEDNRVVVEKASTIIDNLAAKCLKAFPEERYYSFISSRYLYSNPDGNHTRNLQLLTDALMRCQIVSSQEYKTSVLFSKR